ncbi:MAG: plastocyanin, partial [Salinirussus sp.]
APFSSPVINAGGFWLYRSESPGTYDVFCAPHEFFGMVMRLVVGDPDDSDYDGDFGPSGPPPQPRPPVSRVELNMLGITSFPFPTATEVLGTDALTVSNIDSNGSVSVSDVEADL